MEKLYTQEYAAQIEKAMEDETLLEALAKAESKAEIIALFAARDIEMDEEMAQDIYTKIHQISASGELDEEMLDAVSGGIGPILGTLGTIAMIAAGVITFYITVKVGVWIVNKIL